MSAVTIEAPDTETDPKLSVIHTPSGELLPHQDVKKVFWKDSRSMVRAKNNSTNTIPFQEGDMCVLVYESRSIERRMDYYSQSYANSDLLKFPPWHDDI